MKGGGRKKRADGGQGAKNEGIRGRVTAGRSRDRARERKCSGSQERRSNDRRRLECTVEKLT